MEFLLRLEKQIGDAVPPRSIDALLLPVGVPVGEHLGREEVDCLLESGGSEAEGRVEGRCVH